MGVHRRVARERNSVLLFFCLLLPWTAVAQRLGGAANNAQTLGANNRIALHGNVFPLALPEFDQGVVSDAQPLRRMMLVLQRTPEQQTALQKFMDEQQDKSSPNYHAWLTPEEFGKQFGPSDADIQTITQWLASHGFTNITVGPGRTVIEFSGNVASARSAFHTEIHRYLVNSEEHIANSSDPQIPAALAPVVAGIVSLHDFRKKPMYHFARSQGLAEVVEP